MRQSIHARPAVLAIASAIALACASAQGAAAGTAVLTHEQVQALLAGRLVAQLLPPLQRIPAGATVAVRDTSRNGLALSVRDSLAASLTRRGIEVWIAPPKGADSTMAASWSVNLELDEARFAVGPPSRGLLVFKAGRCGRQASARLTAELRAADREQPVWSGTPSAAYADVIPAEQAAQFAESSPAWIGQALKDAPKPPPANSGWLERVGVLGLIGGVVLIYAAGAS